MICTAAAASNAAAAGLRFRPPVWLIRPSICTRRLSDIMEARPGDKERGRGGDDKPPAAHVISLSPPLPVSPCSPLRAQVLHYHWAGLDFMLDDSGTPVLIEANRASH